MNMLIYRYISSLLSSITVHLNVIKKNKFLFMFIVNRCIRDDVTKLRPEADRPVYPPVGRDLSTLTSRIFQDHVTSIKGNIITFSYEI